MLVAVVDCREYLLDEEGCWLFWEWLLFCNLIEEFSSSTQFGDNVEELFILIELIDFDDIGMI
jgi:hypothetical protein